MLRYSCKNVQDKADAPLDPQENQITSRGVGLSLAPFLMIGKNYF